MKKLVFPITNDLTLKLPYYFKGVGCSYEQENIYRPSGYPDYQWIQCRSGQGELILNNTKYILSEGQGILLCPNEPHEYHAITEKWTVDWIIFGGSEIGNFMNDLLNIDTSHIYYVTTPHRIADKLLELYNTACSDNPTKNLICSSIVYAILIDILSLTSLTQNTSIANKFNKLTPVLDFIDRNYTSQLALEQLAQIAGISPQYLCTVFKKYTAQTLFEYINMVRIRKSKELLLSDRNMQIKEISECVGFNDVSYFCLVFKRFENMSPMDFRNLHN